MAAGLPKHSAIRSDNIIVVHIGHIVSDIVRLSNVHAWYVLALNVSAEDFSDYDTYRTKGAATRYDSLARSLAIALYIGQS